MHREEKGPRGFAKMVRDLESAEGQRVRELESAKGHRQSEQEQEPGHLGSEADHLEPERELGLRPEQDHLGWEERQRHLRV
jgi:hypothetical protein